MSINLNNIKTQLKTILDAANTIGASPVDLSNGLATRVQRVSKINPAKIPLQASLFPLITMYYDNKAIEPLTTAKNQATGKRRANITLKVVASVWHSNFASYDEDPAEEDIEKLTENLEEIIRYNGNINGVVDWSFPRNVQYFTTIIDEQVHVRTSEMDLDLVVFY